MDTLTTPVLWYRVASRSNPDRSHVVRRLAAGDWRCDCLAYAYGKRKDCWHIRAAQGWFICGFEGTFERPCCILVPPVKSSKQALAVQGDDDAKEEHAIVLSTSSGDAL